MRIISTDTQERITKCKCCNTVIAYRMEEVKRGYDEKRIACPVCKEYVKVSIFDRKVKEYGNIKKGEDTSADKKKKEM